MVTFLPAGDTGLVVEFGDAIDPTINEQVMDLDAAIRAEPPEGVVETVPTFRSVLIHFDPLRTSAESLSESVRALIGSRSARTMKSRHWKVPVCYEAEHAPDLHDVAERSGLTPDDVVAMHSGRAYRVYMIGFVPGYPYMGDLDERLVLPRREDPRTRVPVGAVAIATSLTAIYPVESPGGWHLIGATPIRLFDPGDTPPALFSPGDKVSFQPVDSRRFERIRDEAAKGIYTPEYQEIAS
ncbi:5-oxoprolinase subunit PxpB [Ferruginivarius sediminum]|uniref:5-oxoprolinase subunit PxpB n=1 Tax=Ferruginivarius sediminum TaxID=2661937 RepID=UPI0019D456FC|nr:5-oxoprolinase subunit PxpB [Ferruginivarius sediminum]